MDAAKLRLIAGAAAALFGAAGAAALAAALAIVLAPVLGLAFAVVVSALLMLAAASACLYVALAPDEPIEEDMAEVEQSAANLLADLPFDTVKAMVEKQPIAALSVALMAGYALRNDPRGAARNLRSIVSAFI